MCTRTNRVYIYNNIKQCMMLNMYMYNALAVNTQVAVYYIVLYTRSKKGGKFGASLLLLLLLFSNVQETDLRFIGAKTVLRSAPSSSFAPRLQARIAYSLISHFTLHNAPSAHGVAGGAISYQYARIARVLGFGLFSTLYCCQMGPRCKPKRFVNNMYI